MSDELKITMLKGRIKELEDTLRLAQTAMATHARNALTALEEGDEDEIIEILKAMAGDK